MERFVSGSLLSLLLFHMAKQRGQICYSVPNDRLDSTPHLWANKCVPFSGFYRYRPSCYAQKLKTDTGIMPSVAALFTNIKHQFCSYLWNPQLTLTLITSPQLIIRHRNLILFMISPTINKQTIRTFNARYIDIHRGIRLHCHATRGNNLVPFIQ